MTRGTRLIAGLRVDRDASARLLAEYGPFAATERLLMELVKAAATARNSTRRSASIR